MRTELDSYARELDWVLEQVCTSLAGLTPAQLGWRPATAAPNSAYAIATHVLASTRVYALGFGCRHPAQRDRHSEFTAVGSDSEELIGRLRGLSREIASALAVLVPATLDDRIVPAKELWGTGAPQQISRREALLESIRHAAIHLGELRLTRDLAIAQA
jgi:DinB superfamily